MSDYKMKVKEHVRSINTITLLNYKLASESLVNAQTLKDAESKVTPMKKKRYGNAVEWVGSDAAFKRFYSYVVIALGKGTSKQFSLPCCTACGRNALGQHFEAVPQLLVHHSGPEHNDVLIQLKKRFLY